MSHKETAKAMLNKLKEVLWPWLAKAKNKKLETATGLIVLSALLVLMFSSQLSNAASVGDFIAGFAGALAFLWLVAGYRMQAEELSAQKEELKLQRIALQNQVSELKSMTRFAAIDQVKSMVDSALHRLSQSGGEITKPEQFFAAMLPGPEWKVLAESTDPEEVMAAYTVYGKKHGPADTFVSGFASAARFYLRSIGNEHVDYNLPDQEFVVINNPWLKDVPYLSTYLQMVTTYAEQKLNYEPGHKIFMLAFLVASQKMSGNPDIIKKESIAEIMEYLKEHDKELPEIAKT